MKCGIKKMSRFAPQRRVSTQKKAKSLAAPEGAARLSQ
jgi:hypothetical protein